MKSPPRLSGNERHLVQTIHTINPRSSAEEIHEALSLLEPSPKGRQGRVYIGRLAMDNTPKDSCEDAYHCGLRPTQLIDAHMPDMYSGSWTPARYIGAAYVPAGQEMYWKERIRRIIPMFLEGATLDRFARIHAEARYTQCVLASALCPAVEAFPDETIIAIQPEEIPIATQHERDALEYAKGIQQNIREILEPIIDASLAVQEEIYASWFWLFRMRTYLRLEKMLTMAQSCIRTADAARVGTEMQVYGRALGEDIRQEATTSSSMCMFQRITEMTDVIRIRAEKLLPKRDTNTRHR